MGGQIDYEKVAVDREELVKAIKAGTGRDDLDVGEPTWLLETRWVPSHGNLSTYSVWNRPNIRMTDSFSKGRVFLAGGA